MLAPLLSDKAKKKITVNYLVINIILLSAFGFIYIHASLISHNWHAFVMGVAVFIVIYLISILAIFLNYARTPAQIKSITEDGFIYVTVTGKTREIAWKNVVKIVKFKSYNDYEIIYKTKTGNECIEVRADIGEKIKREWERWKQNNTV